MRRRALRLLPLALTLAVIVPVPAGADHDADAHSKIAKVSEHPNADGATNSDLAFWGDLAYAGNYNGFRIFDISGATPTLVSDVFCPGPQNDVTVWDRDGNGEADILFLSVDSVMFGPACGMGAVPLGDPNINSPSSGYWEGIRIFDVSNPAAPVQIGDVYQDCGSHTHTLVPDPEDNRVLLYNSSYSLRWGPTCGPGGASVGHPVDHGVIQVVEVSWSETDPLGPVSAVEIAEPEIVYPGDDDGTFDPCPHGGVLCEPSFHVLRACHDLGVYMPELIVGAACAQQAQVWKIDPETLLPDTTNPLWVYDDRVDTDGPGGGDVAVDFWHSATFSWDGKIVNFIDESFGAGCPTVTSIAGTPSDTGRMFFFNVKNGKLQSHFVEPRPESAGGDYCSAHLGIPAPAKNRDLLVNAWYTGGVDVIDFQNPKRPVEIAYYDAAPTTANNNRTGSNNWAVYPYSTTGSKKATSIPMYGSDGVGGGSFGRGFVKWVASVDSFKLVGLDFLNPQTQMEKIN